MGDMHEVKYKVLLVENEACDIAYYQHCLKNIFHDDIIITVSRKLKHALKEAATARHDIILLDTELPDCSGIKTVQRMWEVNSEIPIIVLAGAEQAEYARQTILAGANDYLIKELDNEGFAKELIHYWVNYYHQHHDDTIH